MPQQRAIELRGIAKNALQVVEHLQESQHQAYLVGGCVRDLLLDKTPKDFDVATDAHPEQILRLFKRCRLIGRRFRLAYVYIGRDLTEVATFRAAHDARSTNADGHIVRDNVYGNITQDAIRRDFTINALYYDPSKHVILDYTGGLEDLETRTLQVIGDPSTRYREDPVRMLRAARLCAKLDFTLADASRAPIEQLANLLGAIPPMRLFDETLKLLQTGHAVRSMSMLREMSLLQHLLPTVADALDTRPHFEKMLDLALKNTDARIAVGKPVTPAFLYAVFLWPAVDHLIQAQLKAGKKLREAYRLGAESVLSAHATSGALPARFGMRVRDIWCLQPRLLDTRSEKGVSQLMTHASFRAGYDFIELREQAGEQLNSAAAFWESAQTRVPAEHIQSARRTQKSGRGRGRGRGGARF